MTSVNIDIERQLAFARLSGDFNPLHVDLVQSRRSQFGQPVVHGVHLVMCVLGALPIEGRWSIASMTAKFRQAVLVGETASIQISGAGPEFVATVLVGSRICVSIRVLVRAGNTGREKRLPEALTAVSWLAPELSMSDLEGLCGNEELALDTSLSKELFGRFAETFDAVDQAFLLATTRIVGMRCPGQYALFRQLSWTSDDDLGATSDASMATYEVVATAPRFAVMTLDVTCEGLRVSAEVIVRPAPIAQPGAIRIAEVVEMGEFSGVRSLVIGGSRGLGELAARATSVGGGVALSTSRGDVVRVDRPSAHLSRTVLFDVRAPLAHSLSEFVAFRPTHLLYFATPPIVRRSMTRWDAEVYAEFLDVYARRLSDLLSALEGVETLRGVFYPSTVFIDQPQPGFGEYAAAKRAGEALVEGWQSQRPGRHVAAPRLPVLVTDQTSSRGELDATSNMHRLVPELRDLFRRP
jgi:acyl dehydratase